MNSTMYLLFYLSVIMNSFFHKYIRLLSIGAFLLVILPCISCSLKVGIKMSVGSDLVVDAFPEGINRELVRAISKGDLGKVKELVADGADVNVTCDNSFTPLYVSIHYRQPEIFEYLLEQGADYHVEAEMSSKIKYRYRIYMPGSLISAVALDDDAAYLRILLKFVKPDEQDELFLKYCEWASGTFRLPTNDQLSPKDIDKLDREKIDLFKKAGYQIKPLGVYPKCNWQRHQFYLQSELFQAGFPFPDFEMNDMITFIQARKYEDREMQISQNYPSWDLLCETIDDILPGTVDKIKKLAETSTKENHKETMAELESLSIEFSRAQLKRFDSLKAQFEEKWKSNPNSNLEQPFVNYKDLSEPEKSEMFTKAWRMEKAVNNHDAIAVINLLDRGVPVNAINNTGESPLDCAQFYNFPELTQILINAGGRSYKSEN